MERWILVYSLLYYTVVSQNCNSDTFSIAKNGNPVFSANSQGVDVPSGVISLQSPNGFQLKNVNGQRSSDSGAYSSISIDNNSLPLISFFSGSANSDLRVAHCLNTLCTKTIVSTLDSVGNVGLWTSIKIGSDGFGAIAYTESTLGQLKFAHCLDADCSIAEISIVDSLQAQYSSLVIGSDGKPAITYYDQVNRRLKFARCNTIQCASSSITIVDGTGVGKFCSIVIGQDGFPLISYFDEDNKKLKVAHCLDVSCTNKVITVLDSIGTIGSYTSITLGSDGFGAISYLDTSSNSLKLSKCTNGNCTVASNAVVTSGGSWTSIGLGNDNLLFVAFSTGNALKILHCTNDACTQSNVQLIKNTTTTGLSLVVVGGLPTITFSDSTTGSLSLVRCIDVLCSSSQLVSISSQERSSVQITKNGFKAFTIDEIGDTSITGALSLGGILNFGGGSLSKPPVSITTRDTSTGCPNLGTTRPSLISQTFTVSRQALIYSTSSAIRKLIGRSDYLIYLDGNIQARAITQTETDNWLSAFVSFSAVVDRGTHTIATSSAELPNWGCGPDWSYITTLIIEM